MANTGGGYKLTINTISPGLSALPTVPSASELPAGITAGTAIKFDSNTAFPTTLFPDAGNACNTVGGACTSNCSLSLGIWTCTMTGFPLHSPWTYNFTIQAFGTFALNGSGGVSTILSALPSNCTASPAPSPNATSITCTSAKSPQGAAGAQ